MAVLFVMAILSITLAVSYAMLHSQTVDIAIHRNVKRSGDARQAAITGLNVALRKIHEPNWRGVDSAIVGQLNPNARYEVTFTTGDASLQPGDPQYDEYPYRLTLTSTGAAVDAADPTVHVTHQVQAVVQLIRRAYSDPLAGGPQYDKYALYQWGTEAGDYHPPVRIEGDVYSAGPINLCSSYPSLAANLVSFHGQMDEIGVFERTLTDSEIASLQNAYIGGNLDTVFSSLGPRDRWSLNEGTGARYVYSRELGTQGFLDGAVAGVTGAVGQGVDFDGLNDSIDLGGCELPETEMSAVFWIKPDASQTAGARLLQVANGPTYADTEWGVGLRLDATGVRVWTGVQTAESEYASAYSSRVLPADTWTFVAMTYDGSQVRLYENGVLTASANAVTSSMVSRSNAALTAGGNPPGSPRASYLFGVDGLYESGFDYRMFTGSIRTPLQLQPARDLSLLQRDLRLDVQDVPASPAPISVQNTGDYQLYPGGKRWPIERVASTLNDVELAPSPTTNPLGLFQSDGSWVLQQNVIVSGSMVAGAAEDIYLWGSGIDVNPVKLLPLYGETQTKQLPAIYGGHDLRVGAAAAGSVRGATIVQNRLRVESRPAGVQLTLDGGVVCHRIEIDAGQDFLRGSDWWREEQKDFFERRRHEADVWFPSWLANDRGVSSEPTLTLRRDSGHNPESSVHWQDWSQPVYAAAADDGNGLRWELLEWRDALDNQQQEVEDEPTYEY